MQLQSVWKLASCTVFTIGLSAAGSCASGSSDVEKVAETTTLIGDPLSGITAADFATVKDNFAQAESIDDGLGPVFNERACGNCHSNGNTGGAGNNIERRYGRYDENGESFNPLTSE